MAIRRPRHPGGVEGCYWRLAYDRMSRPGVREEPVRALAPDEDGYCNVTALGRCKSHVCGARSIVAGDPRGCLGTRDHRTDCDDLTGFHEAPFDWCALEAACELVTLSVVMVL
jgi:hypothetical protein